jgi:hypothetical protein
MAVRMRLASVSFVSALVVCLAVALSGQSVAPVSADEMTSQLQASKAAIEKYQDPFAAVRDGYLSTVGCVAFTTSGSMNGMPYPAGAMGVHFVNFALVGKLDPTKPQVLLYIPTSDGKLKLAGAEWFVPYSKGMKAPELFGHKFYGPMYGHYPVMPKSLVHYDLHVWLFSQNPNGMFAPTNSSFSCPSSGYNFVYTKPDMPAM